MTIASFLVARWLGDELLGLLGMMLAGVQLVTTVCEAFPNTMIRFVSNRRASNEESGALLGWRLAWFTMGLACGGACLVGLAGWATAKYQNFGIIAICVALAVLRVSRQSFDSLFRATRWFTPPTVIGILCTGPMAALIIYFIANGHGIGYYLAVMAGFTAINAAVLIFVYARKNRISLSVLPRVNPAVRREFLTYSYPLMLRGLTGFLFLKINIWLIGWLATTADAGQFRLTDQFLTIPGLVFSAILTAIAPRVAEAESRGIDDLSNLCSRMYGLMLLVSIPIAAFFLFNSYFVELAFPGFETASLMLTFFAPVMLIRGVSNASSLLLIQGGKPKAAFWLAFIPSMANLVFALAGYCVYGVIGLVAATAVLHFMTYVITLIVIHRLFQLPFRVRFR